MSGQNCSNFLLNYFTRCLSKTVPNFMHNYFFIGCPSKTVPNFTHNYFFTRCQSKTVKNFIYHFISSSIRNYFSSCKTVHKIHCGLVIGLRIFVFKCYLLPYNKYTGCCIIAKLLNNSSRTSFDRPLNKQFAEVYKQMWLSQERFPKLLVRICITYVYILSNFFCPPDY